MTEEMFKKIKQLPPLPESAMQVEAVYHDPDSSFNDMVKILDFASFELAIDNASL